MRKIPLWPLLGTLASAPAWANTHYSYVKQPDAPVYFGHIAYCDLRGDESDPRVLHQGRADADRAVPNTPLLPGDTIVTGTGRRCEARFDTGTVIRLDGSTRLRLETILAQALTKATGVTNLLLEQGRVSIQYHDYDDAEVFQVLTPTAAVKFRDSAVATVDREADGSTGVETDRGSVKVLFGRATGKTRKKTVQAGQRLAVGPSHAAVTTPIAEAAAPSDFQAWSESRNDMGSPRFATPPLQALRRSPPVVIDFAARSESWGSWVWSDVYGSVWRPHDNSRPNWRPYVEGRWTDVQGELFWVADEPWGWVPYHLGYWTWLTRHGWVWVPGSWFAPAWVKWAPGRRSIAWRPVDFWDFYPDDTLTSWDGSSLGGQSAPPTDRPPDHAIPRRPPKPGPKPSDPPDRPRPREIRSVEDRVRAAARTGGGSLLKDEAAVVRRSAVVSAWGELSLGKAEPKAIPAATEQVVPAARELSTGVSFLPGLPRADFEAARFRDWNPDVRAARDVGGTIYYSSRDNAVHCASCQAVLAREGGNSSSPSGGSGGTADSGGASSTSASGSAASTGGPAGGHDAGGGGAARPRDN